MKEVMFSVVELNVTQQRNTVFVFICPGEGRLDSTDVLSQDNQTSGIIFSFQLSLTRSVFFLSPACNNKSKGLSPAAHN